MLPSEKDIGHCGASVARTLDPPGQLIFLSARKPSQTSWELFDFTDLDGLGNHDVIRAGIPEKSLVAGGRDRKPLRRISQAT